MMTDLVLRVDTRAGAQLPKITRRASVASVLAATFVAAFLVTPSAALADTTDHDPSTWQVQPAGENGPSEQPYFVLDAAPGATLHEAAAITNLSEHEITVRLFATDALNAASGDFDLLPSSEQPQDIGAWTTMDAGTVAPDGSVTIPARSRLTVPFTIVIPANATPGDHVGGVVGSMTSLRTSETGEQVLMDARVAARIYLAVGGELVPRVQVGNVRAERTGDWWNPFDGTLRVTWTATNTGNLRLAGVQEVSVRGPFGWDLGTAAASDLSELLPGSSAEQSVTLNGIPAAGLLTVAGVVQPVDQTARLTGPLNAVPFSGTVVAVPWAAVIALLVLAAIVWLIVASVRRRRAAVRALRDQITALERASATSTIGETVSTVASGGPSSGPS